MNFGMFTNFHIRKGMTQAEAFEESFNQVEASERLGVDCVWLAEQHFSPRPDLPTRHRGQRPLRCSWFVQIACQREFEPPDSPSANLSRT